MFKVFVLIGLVKYYHRSVVSACEDQEFFFSVCVGGGGGGIMFSGAGDTGNICDVFTMSMLKLEGPDPQLSDRKF